MSSATSTSSIIQSKSNSNIEVNQTPAIPTSYDFSSETTTWGNSDYFYSFDQLSSTVELTSTQDVYISVSI